MVQVHHDEEVANRIGPESCAAAREGISEALTGERTGQPLSRESTLFPGADVVPLTEGNTDGRDIASAQTDRRGLRHWHVRTLGCGDFKTSIFEPSADCVYNKRVIVNDENARHDGRISMLKFVFPTDPSN
jgi:hypothetical protein